MTTERFTDLVRRLRPAGDGIRSVEVTEAEMDDLTPEQADELVALYGGTTMMMLPTRERAFFDWLRVNDEPIWNDLWGADETPYHVSLGNLPNLLPNRRGFVICDLVEHQNVYFSAENITAEDGSPFLDAAIQIVKREGKLSMDQAFVVEVWRAPIDQWRFAYLYRQPLDQVKQMVAWLVEEEILQLPVRDAEEEQQQVPDGER